MFRVIVTAMDNGKVNVNVQGAGPPQGAELCHIGARLLEDMILGLRTPDTVIGTTKRGGPSVSRAVPGFRPPKVA